ncbi:hypothetical protein CRYUN_Cryun32bG0067400 [Craigia yunnanensis]
MASSSNPHEDGEDDAIIRPNGDDKYFVFKPRALTIIWGDDSRYWRIPSRISSTNGSNGEEVAELIQVCWLEITGSVKLNPLTRYQITFTLSFKEHAFGWRGNPLFMMAKVGTKGRYKWKKLMELENLPKEPTEVPNDNDPFVVEVPKPQIDTTLFFGLYEVWSGKWKGGLIVHQADVKEKK